MMLVIMIKNVRQHRQRLVYGAAIVLSANYGGAMTVIGDPTGLVLWNMEAVTASGLFLALVLPCLAAWATTMLLLSGMLPERIDLYEREIIYRGDDTNLNNIQRIIMLIVGIGGLWFIPTFHNITKLSPFLGALCVLSVLWIVNEIFNRKLMNVDKMIQRRMPRVLQYGVIQMMLFVMGIMLALGVVKETGVVTWLSVRLTDYVDSAWVMGTAAALMSTVVDNFATAITFFSFNDVCTSAEAQQYINNMYAQDGTYWIVIAYAVAVGGNIFGLGSMSGLAYLKMERVTFSWYLRNITWRVLAGAAAGAAILSLTV